MTLLYDSWLPEASMRRVILHWTAGTYNASATDLEHYHFLIQGNGNAVRGDHSVDDNEAPLNTDDYAAHTKNCNTGSIGIAVCCMAGAIESPFSAGEYPLTENQWAWLIQAAAELCQAYQIQVTKETVLSHAEVQGTLGIKQNGKWDITRLPFLPEVVGATEVGNLFRSGVKEWLK